MRQKILLIDDSVTVQKVVSLSLDKNRYQLLIARNRTEASRFIVDENPDLILVSDQVADLEVSTFPKEVETWLGRTHDLSPMVLITGENISEAKHYKAVLKKPFTPQTLMALLHIHADKGAAPEPLWAKAKTASNFADDFEDQKLQKVFNETFSEEGKLVDETFHAMEEDRPTQLYERPKTAETKKSSLWTSEPVKKERPVTPEHNPVVLSTSDSMAYKAQLDSEVQSRLEKDNLTEVVERVLQRVLPPIVEKLVAERLDALLAEEDKMSLEAKA